MIMLTYEESTKLVKMFFRIYYETSAEIVELANKLLDPNNTSQSPIKSWKQYLDSAKSKLIEEGQFAPTVDINQRVISEEQAFEAMILFLADNYRLTNSNDIGTFLSELLHGTYGETSDPAAWYNWERFLQKVISERQTTDENSAN